MMNAPGFCLTQFRGYDDIGAGGQFNFSALYNLSIFNYTGDIGVGLGITTYIGDFDSFEHSTQNITYLTIPIEMTCRGKKWHWGFGFLNAILIGHNVVGYESIPLSNTTLCPYKLALTQNIGWTTSTKWDIGFYFNWWFTNTWSKQAFFGESVYNPSYEFGFHLAYRFKIGK